MMQQTWHFHVKWYGRPIYHKIVRGTSIFQVKVDVSAVQSAILSFLYILNIFMLEQIMSLFPFQFFVFCLAFQKYIF